MNLNSKYLTKFLRASVPAILCTEYKQAMTYSYIKKGNNLISYFKNIFWSGIKLDTAKKKTSKPYSNVKHFTENEQMLTKERLFFILSTELEWNVNYMWSHQNQWASYAYAFLILWGL